MKAVITGDVINSRSVDTNSWMKMLKTTLGHYGKAPKAWDIYRGDSFQVLVPAEEALKVAFHLKSCMKSFEALDLRFGIGIGEVEFKSEKITTYNGSAFVRSGDSFEALKKQSIIMKSGNTHFDQTMNTMFGLAMYIADRWTPVVSKVIKMAIEHPGLRQKELAELLDKSQSNISEALKRGGFDEIMTMNRYYESEISKL